MNRILLSLVFLFGFFSIAYAETFLSVKVAKVEISKYESEFTFNKGLKNEIKASLDPSFLETQVSSLLFNTLLTAYSTGSLVDLTLNDKGPNYIERVEMVR